MFSNIDRCKETFLAVLNCVTDAIIVADKDKNLLQWNDAATRLLKLGATDDHNWSKHYGLFRADGVTPYEEEDLPLVKAINGVATANEVMYIKNDHMEHGIWVNINAIPLSYGGVVIFRDISESYKACASIQEIIAGHEETLAQPMSPPTPTPAPAPAPTSVVVKIEIPATGTVIQHDIQNPDPRTP